MTQTCERRRTCKRRAIGLIPLPKNINIHVCEAHFLEAMNQLFYVRRYDETMDRAEARFKSLVDEKHHRLRRAA